MNKNFCRALTLLRKERGLSQKQAASDLNVSQALLSHYEKGIRECSLDFVNKAADYYEVTTDFLLGRTAERTDASSHGENEHFTAKQSISRTPNERLIINTLHVIYGTLSKISNRKLTSTVSGILMLCEYQILRLLFSKTGSALFSKEDSDQGYSLAAQTKLTVDLYSRCNAASSQYISALSDTEISEEILAKEYSDCASSVFHVISHAENLLAKMR